MGNQQVALGVGVVIVVLVILYIFRCEILNWDCPTPAKAPVQAPVQSPVQSPAEAPFKYCATQGGVSAIYTGGSGCVYTAPLKVKLKSEIDSGITAIDCSVADNASACSVAEELSGSRSFPVVTCKDNETVYVGYQA